MNLTVIENIFVAQVPVIVFGMYAFNDNLWKYEIDINYSDQI